VFGALDIEPWVEIGVLGSLVDPSSNQTSPATIWLSFGGRFFIRRVRFSFSEKSKAVSVADQSNSRPVARHGLTEATPRRGLAEKGGRPVVRRARVRRRARSGVASTTISDRTRTTLVANRKD